MNLAKAVIEVKLDQDIKEHDSKIKTLTADLIEDHKDKNSDINLINLEKMKNKYNNILNEVVQKKE